MSAFFVADVLERQKLTGGKAWPTLCTISPKGSFYV